MLSHPKISASLVTTAIFTVMSSYVSTIAACWPMRHYRTVGSRAHEIFKSDDVQTDPLTNCRNWTHLACDRDRRERAKANCMRRPVFVRINYLDGRQRSSISPFAPRSQRRSHEIHADVISARIPGRLADHLGGDASVSLSADGGGDDLSAGAYRHARRRQADPRLFFCGRGASREPSRVRHLRSQAF